MRVWIALTVALLLAGAGCARAQVRADSISARLDPSLRRLAAAPPDTTIAVFIRVTRNVGARERRQLQRAGAQVRTVAGHLLTARVAARNLRRVAALPFVGYIEASRLLKPQGRAHPWPPVTPAPDGDR